jgi:spermidine synthase
MMFLSRQRHTLAVWSQSPRPGAQQPTLLHGATGFVLHSASPERHAQGKIASALNVAQERGHDTSKPHGTGGGNKVMGGKLNDGRVNEKPKPILIFD